MKENGSIVRGGMGGFLNPPGHPEHDWHVESGAGWRSSASLSHAVETEYLSDELRREAAAKLAEWDADKLPLDAPEVVAWVRSVLGYFANCYAGEGPTPWRAGSLKIERGRDPMISPADHAGVNMIRNFYPEFTPTAADFANAKWGS